jgi:hypothetical protein
MNEHALEWLDLPLERMFFRSYNVFEHRNPEGTASIDDCYNLLPDMSCPRWCTVRRTGDGYAGLGVDSGGKRRGRLAGINGQKYAERLFAAKN